jgi:hypothetical protein
VAIRKNQNGQWKTSAQVRADIEIIEEDFDSRRDFLELIDLQVTIRIVNGKRIASVKCKIGTAESLPVVYTYSGQKTTQLSH